MKKASSLDLHFCINCGTRNTLSPRCFREIGTETLFFDAHDFRTIFGDPIDL